MSWGEALVDVGGSILGGLISSKSAGKANKAYQKAMEDIIRQAGVTTGQQGALFQPYGEFGQESLNRLNALENAAATGDFSMLTGSPEYQFLKQQGESDLARNLAARGGLFGGEAQKQFTQFNNALALQAALNPYVSRQQAGINTGMAGAAGQAQPLGNFLNVYGQARGIQGQSAAGKAASQGNIWQSVLGDIGKSVIKGMG
jgi:hypothetical protein